MKNIADGLLTVTYVALLGACLCSGLAAMAAGLVSLFCPEVECLTR